MKKSLTFLLAITMMLTLLPVTAFADLELVLNYGDYYTFEGAGSVSVIQGDRSIEAEDTTIHAVGVTDSPVTVTVDSVDYQVMIKPAKLNIVLVDGQSNAMGSAGFRNAEPICPEKGYGYIWRGGLQDLATGSYLTRINETGKSVGFYPALAAEWYALTGEKTVIIHKYLSGNTIMNWTDSRIDSIVNDVTACINTIKNDPNFEIAHTGYYWLQGESDCYYDQTSDPDTGKYLTTSQYEEQFIKIHNAYIHALTVEGVPAPIGGIIAVRTHLNGYFGNIEYCGARAAQQDLANQYGSIIMASVLPNSWTEATKNTETTYSYEAGTVTMAPTGLIYNLHYYQAGYNVIGMDAAFNVYKAVNGAAAATDFVLSAWNGITKYEEGAVIDVADNKEHTGNQNEQEFNAAQLVVEPNGTCAGVTFTLKDKHGTVRSGIITGSGYIADCAKITEPMTLEVSAAGVTKTYTIKNSSAPDLTPYKDTAIAELEAYVSSQNLSDEAAKTEIIANGNAAIDSAEDIEAVDSALATAKSSADLQKAKEDAIDAINQLAGDEMERSDEMKALVAEAISKIEAAETSSNVTNLLSDYSAMVKTQADKDASSGNGSNNKVLFSHILDFLINPIRSIVKNVRAFIVALFR